MRKPVIDTLESQHRALTQLAGEVTQAVKSGDRPKAIEALGRLRALLVAHLQLEEAQFYPELTRLASASGNEAAATTARLFRDNMQRIAEGVMSFFERYAAQIGELEQFTRDLQLNLDVLSRRMGEEERTLHPMLQRLAEAAGQKA